MARVKNWIVYKKRCKFVSSNYENILYYGLQKFDALVCVLVVNHSTQGCKTINFPDSTSKRYIKPWVVNVNLFPCSRHTKGIAFLLFIYLQKTFWTNMLDKNPSITSVQTWITYKVELMPILIAVRDISKVWPIGGWVESTIPS